MKHLLIVYHTQTGNTARLAQAVLKGANNELVTEIETRFLMARDSASRIEPLGASEPGKGARSPGISYQALLDAERR